MGRLKEAALGRDRRCERAHRRLDHLDQVDLSDFGRNLPCVALLLSNRSSMMRACARSPGGGAALGFLGSGTLRLQRALELNSGVKKGQPWAVTLRGHPRAGRTWAHLHDVQALRLPPDQREVSCHRFVEAWPGQVDVMHQHLAHPFELRA